MHPRLASSGSLDGLSSLDIVHELNSLTESATCASFGGLTAAQRESFIACLFESLPDTWRDTSRQARFSIARAIGNILVHLAPFHAEQLMTSLCEVIGRVTDESLLLLTCFCCLSKFHSQASLTRILADTPVLHLFGKNVSEHLPTLVKELQHLPREFLHTLAEFFVTMAVSYPDVRHLPRAAAAIVEMFPNDLIWLVNMETPLRIVVVLFADKIPQLQEGVIDCLKGKAVLALSDEHITVTDYESACLFLALCIESRHVKESEVSEAITEAVFKQSRSMTSLLRLPVPEDLVRTLYQKEPVEGKENVWRLNIANAHLEMLLGYFARQQNFREELMILLNQELSAKSVVLAAVITVIGEICDEIGPDELNRLLLKLFTLKEHSWVKKMWTLRMILKLDLGHISPLVSGKMFELIRVSAVAKSEVLRQVAKQVAVEILEHNENEFREFMDTFVTRLDPFDLENFERRVSFIAYLFENTHRRWTLSFMHLAKMLNEVVSTWTVSEECMNDIFSIVGFLSPNLANPELVSLFTARAVAVINTVYRQFIGERIGVDRPASFSKCRFELGRVGHTDMDLTVNPGLSHRDVLKGMEGALMFLSRIPCDEKAEETTYILCVIGKLVALFPTSVVKILLNLMNYNAFSLDIILPLVKQIVRVTRAGVDVLWCVHLIDVCLLQFEDFDIKSLKVDDFRESVRVAWDVCNDLDDCIIQSAERVLPLLDIELTDKVRVKPARHHRHDTDARLPESPSEEAYAYVEGARLKQPVGLQSHVQSLTPFYAAGVDVPEELLVPVFIGTFCRNSAYKMKKAEADALLAKVVETKNSRCLYYFLQNCRRNKRVVDMTPYLEDRICSVKGNFSNVFHMIAKKRHTFADLSPSEMKYVKSSTSENLFEYIMGANSAYTRQIAATLIQFDTEFFMKCLLETGKVKFLHIENMTRYVTTVRLPYNELFSFILSTIMATTESRKKRHLSKRLLSVFVARYIDKREIVERAHGLLTCDVGAVSNIPILLEKGAPHIIELYYESIVLSRAMNCRDIAQTLSHVVPKGTIFGSSLDVMLGPSLLESVKTVAESPFPSSIVFLHDFFTMRMNPVVLLPPSMLETLLSCKTTRTGMLDGSIERFGVKFFKSYGEQKARYENHYKSVFRHLLSCMSTPVTSTILAALREYVRILDPDSEELLVVLSVAEPLFDMPIIPREAGRLLCEACSKKGDGDRAILSMSEYLRMNAAYTDYVISELATRHSMTLTPPEHDVMTVIPICKSFIATFCAITVAENANSALNHRSAYGQFSEAHETALRLLEDPKLKVFAPLFACMDTISVPESLQAYIEALKTEQKC